MGSFWDIVALATVEVAADFNLKWYAHGLGGKYLWQGLAGYVGVIYFLIRSLSGLIESVAAYVLLGERLHNPIQYVGLALTVIGIVLLRQ